MILNLFKDKLNVLLTFHFQVCQIVMPDSGVMQKVVNCCEVHMGLVGPGCSWLLVIVNCQEFVPYCQELHLNFLNTC